MRLGVSAVLRLCAIAAAGAVTLSAPSVRAAMGALSGIDANALDRSCRPCADFYQFAVGGWIARHPIPSAASGVAAFQDLQDQTLRKVQGMLAAAAAPGSRISGDAQRVGNFYASCMNTAAIERAGTQPIDGLLRLANEVTPARLAMTLGELRASGVPGFFWFFSAADPNGEQYVMKLLPYGGALPDRSYYVNDDPQTVVIRNQYVDYVGKMLALSGTEPAAAQLQANKILQIEITLAKASKDRVAQADPRLTSLVISVPQLQAMTPNLNWTEYIKGYGAPGVREVNASDPDFLKTVNALVATLPVEDVRSYLRWQVINRYAEYLPAAFARERFNFVGRVLEGTQQPEPRSQYCTRTTSLFLSDAVGQMYVKRYFPPAAKARAMGIIRNIVKAMRDDFSSLPWMAPQTRLRAIQKLDQIALRVGYPDHWRDYSAYHALREPYATNELNYTRFNIASNNRRIGHPLDRGDWAFYAMGPTTVDAQYDEHINAVTFPAGLLQPPFFDMAADDAINYGSIGSIIGHEITHAFDGVGRQYDGKGRLVDWWLPSDAEAFEARSQCIVAQYDALSPINGVHENGKLVANEAIADLGGISLAYKAFEKAQSRLPRRTIDGFSPEQRFFLGTAQFFASNQRPEAIRLGAATDEHAYRKFRINATLSNMPDFAKVWFCKLADPMVRPHDQVCGIW